MIFLLKLSLCTGSALGFFRLVAFLKVAAKICLFQTWFLVYFMFELKLEIVKKSL